MMKLSLMNEVVATVNEQWESELADELLTHWQHDAERAKFWRASANFIFHFKNAGQAYVLRFNHADERTTLAIQAEIDYINMLADKGIRVARPVRSVAGNFIESIATDHGIFHTVAFEVLPGKQLDLDQLTPDQLVRWGQALGELHNASAHYTIARRPTWEDQLTWVAEILPADEEIVRQTLVQLRRELGLLAINEDNFGLIHFDFELDNVIWDEDQPGIIDFDDSAYYWFVADVVLALGDLFGDSADKVDLQHETFLHFIKGYRSARPLGQEELKLIPLFLRLDNLITFAKLHHALTPTDPDGELPWMVDLRSKLAAKMQFYRDEFSKYIR